MGKLVGENIVIKIEDRLLAELETHMDNLMEENKELRQENALLKRQLEEHTGGGVGG